MNGPEHYREAERLLALAAQEPEASNLHPLMVSEAQVHATLAQVAAIARTEHERTLVDQPTWQDALR